MSQYVQLATTCSKDTLLLTGLKGGDDRRGCSQLVLDG